MKKEFQNNIEIAHFQSFQSFMTSYLIGCKEQEIIQGKDLPEKAPIELKESEHVIVLFKTIYVPVIALSLTGFHTFSDHVFELKNEQFNELSFNSFIESVCLLEKSSEFELEVLQERVRRSFETINSLLENKRETLESLGNLKDLSFNTTESSLIFGHFSHPYPKLQESSLGENVADLEKKLFLKWCYVHKSILNLESTKHFNDEKIASILEHTLSEKVSTKKDYILYPMHPIQYDFLKRDPLIIGYFNEKLIIDIEETQNKKQWTPTTSMRSIYNESCQWMLKFSLPVRLTNSIRTLQESEVKRGMQLHEVFHSDEALQMKKDIAPLTVIHEPFFMSLKDREGKILKSTIVVFRENPFFDGAKNAIALATLNQFSPKLNTSLLSGIVSGIASKENLNYSEAAQKWFAVFLHKAIMPFVILQSRHGIYLGAHQQNLILDLDSHYYPESSYYRDCQGSGYSEYGFNKFKNTADSLRNPNGNVLPNDFANNLIGYYLFINSTLFTIKTLALQDLKLERELIESFTSTLKSIPNVIDPSFINYILESKTFLIKDNFECCLKNINENVIDNPLKIYKEFKNPFYVGSP